MKYETSFELDGDLIVVEATIVGPSGRADVRLILDTGAVLTTLSPEIAASLGYDAVRGLRTTVVCTATAEERGYLVQLDELSVLGVSARALHANVADLGPEIDGVLGMNFLLDFNLEIRPTERRIIIEPL